MDKAEEIRTKLKELIDPELGVDIVSLGFIYEIEIQNSKGKTQNHSSKLKNFYKVKVVMTLTTAGCPLAGIIGIMVRDKVKELPWVDKVEVELTFDPPWTREMMSEEAKLKLGV